MIQLAREKFEEYVQAALELLPNEFRKALDNIEIIVEDYPTPDELKSVNLKRRDSLLGLYTGIPVTKRGVWYGMTPTLPDQIKIYQKNIEKICHDEEELKEQILITVFHEIGHYFGMNEEEIRNAMKDF